MTSLREEIFEYIKGLPLPSYTKDANIDLYTNAILFRFEKRIDAIYVKHPNLAGIAHNECLDQIKKELLQK